MISGVESGEEPFSPLTELTTVMTEALEAAKDDDHEVRGIIFLSDPESAGIQAFGYDDTTAAIADLMIHLKAMFNSMGKEFGVMTDQGVMLLGGD